MKIINYFINLLILLHGNIFEILWRVKEGACRYLFTTYAKFSVKLTFFTPLYVLVRVKGWEMLVFRKVLGTYNCPLEKWNQIGQQVNMISDSWRIRYRFYVISLKLPKYGNNLRIIYSKAVTYLEWGHWSKNWQKSKEVKIDRKKV